MIKAKYDHRQYRMTKNLSGLKVLLVHDPKASHSAIALSVAAGHFQDPKECPGLAHLLEHCLFSGCKAYPEENQINHYIESNGGQINAWTAAEMSGFNIECAHKDFILCNNMLASMITEPLFPKASINKEIQAIEAEFQYKKHEDQRRIQEVDKETCNPLHPFSRFSSGNKACYQSHTEEQLIEQLRNFHTTYYQAAAMRLCIVSCMGIDQMEQALLPLYENIPNTDIPLPAISAPLFEPEHSGKFIEVKPYKEVRSLVISFSLPDIHQWYRTKPESVISALLGDETKGSLLHFLRHKGWATHVTAGTGIQGSNFKDYTLNIQLTEQGLHYTDDILESLFSYLNLIREEGLPHWRFDELKQLNQLEFDYQEFPKIGKLASQLSTQMHYYPDNHIAYGEYLLDAPNSQIALDLLAFLVPENMRIKRIYPEATTDKITHWYQTPYCISDIPASLISKLKQPNFNQKLSLPAANALIPRDLSLHPTDERFYEPQKITSHTNGELWFGQDNDFFQPKKELFLSLGCEKLNNSQHAAARTRIWTSAAQAFINDHFYEASTAGVFSHIYPHKRGVTLHIAGFSQHHDRIAKTVIEALLDPAIIAPYFEQARQQRLRALNNSLFNKPINRLFATLNNLMHEHSYQPEELTDIIDRCTLEETKEVSSLIKAGYWQAMAYGNWEKSSALEMDSFLASTFNNLSADNYENKVLQLSEFNKQHVLLDCHQEEAALVYYLQGQANTLRDKAMCIAIEQLLAPDYYQMMRYQKQYGYQLGCGYLPFMKAPGIALYIQSPVASVDSLHADTEAFLQAMPKRISQMPKESWNKTRSALERQLGANDQNLSIKCQRLWAALDNENQLFNEFELIKRELREISLDEVAQYLFSLLDTVNKSISMMCLGDKKITQESYTKQLISVAQFRTQTKVYI